MNEIYCSQYIDLWQDHLILVSYFSNRVYLLNRHSGLLEKEYIVRGNPIGDTLFRSFVCYKNKLLLSPYNAESFVLIDLESGEQMLIDSIILDEQKTIKRKFWTTIINGQYAWVLGEEIKEVICLDLDDDCNVIFRYNYDEKENLYWTSGHVIINGIAYIPSRTVDSVLCINTETCTLDIICLNGSIINSGFLDIAITSRKQMLLFDEIGNEFIWSTFGTDIYCTRKLDDKIERCSRQSVVYGETLYRIMLRDDSIEYKKEDNEYRIIDIPCKQTEFNKMQSRYQEGKQSGKLYYFQNRRGDLFVLDLETAEIDCLLINQSPNSLKGRAELLDEIASEKVVTEGVFNLKDFLNLQ